MGLECLDNYATVFLESDFGKLVEKWLEVFEQFVLVYIEFMAIEFNLTSQNFAILLFKQPLFAQNFTFL